MLSLLATPEVTGGVERGGEDLHIVFSTRLGTAPDLDNLKDEDIEIDIDCEDGGCDADFLETAPLDGIEDAIITKVRWTTPHYNFSWKGGKDDLKKLVLAHVRTELNWRRPGLKEKTFEFEYRHFVDGNAE